MEDSVKLPLFEEVLPGGLRYGANYVVEFEPQSLWYETSLTICAEALRRGIRTDYHTFTHPPEDIRRQLEGYGLQLKELEESDQFRIWDSFTVQTGSGQADNIGKFAPKQFVDLTSVKMSDWEARKNLLAASEVTEADTMRLHVDDNTSVLVQFNDEKTVAEHFRTKTVPLVRKTRLAAVHALATGLYSPGFYNAFESFCDGIIDFRAREEEGKMVHDMRVRVVRGSRVDTSWRRIQSSEQGEVSLEKMLDGHSPPSHVQEHGQELLAARFLAEREQVDLSSYAVTGNYLRYDEKERNQLKDLRQSILDAFESTAPSHENHLIWAPPGSGKTSFVRQMQSELGRSVRYWEANLSDIDEQSFRSMLSDASNYGGASLFFVDEVDSRQGESWPYEALLSSMDSARRGDRIVYLLAGSSGDSCEEMTTTIASRPKGKDLLSRIPHGNTHSIPALGQVDNVLVFLGSVQIAAGDSGKKIDQIEKIGLYYAATSPHLKNARKVRDLAFTTVGRVPRGESRVKFDNLFAPGDPENKEFWLSRSKDHPDFVNSYLTLKGATSGDGEEERRLAVIMFTDTVGFTGLGQRDEPLMMQLLQEQRGLVRPLFSKYRGREVKTTGDGFLVEFSSALEAVKCALGIQERLKVENDMRPSERRILIRIGIHLGDVIHTGSDVAGDAVNVASRLEPLARPGGVCVSGQVYSSVVNKVDCHFESMGSPALKNVASPVEVFRVVEYGEGSAPTVQSTTAAATDRVAVLPMANISPDPADEYFADGMTEELISTLSKTAGLRVIARTSVMKYKGTKKTAAEIGKELNAGSILEGSVRKAGNRIRITVQLIHAQNEEHLWATDYDRDLDDVFAIQSDIARRVAQSLRVVLGTQSALPTATTSPVGYVNYLRGRQLWSQRDEDSLKRSVEFFQRALDADPNYAKAYSGLADSYATLALLEFMAPREAYPKAKEAIAKALSLDPLLAEAHTSLGLARFQFDWDWPGAEEEFREAIRITPSYAPAHHYFADYLKAMGRFEEALYEISKAQELDPLNLAINTGVGHVLYLSRQYDKAIEQYAKAVDLDPKFTLTHIWFGRPYLEKGMYSEAISELETAVKLSAESTLALAMLGHGLASAGRKDEALAILEKLMERSKTRYVPSYWIAVIYNGFRDRAKVLEWMERAYDERSSWLVWSNVEPRLEWLKTDPRFAALMSSMRFP